MVPLEQSVHGIGIGARPGYVDGYDGQPAYDVAGKSGVALLHYRSAWAGPTGFFATDYESPIPPGESKTWPDVYLWSQNYTPQSGDRVRVAYGPDIAPPAGWLGHLVLDYVPGDLNWAGPWDWWFATSSTWSDILPAPITDDPWNPLNVTRMHLTVYAIPEPSSLSALGLALLGAGVGVQRRRR